MRCFIAVELPKEVKDYLFNLQKSIGNDNTKIKWVEKKNLHLTLKFLGDVDDENLNMVKSILSKIKFNSFKLKLGDMGVFPNEHYIKVVWVGLSDSNSLVALEKLIDSNLIALFPGEQNFVSHFTLGRVRFVKDKEGFVAKLKTIKVNSIEFSVNEFNLVKSELSKNGPQYTVLETYNLD